MVCIIISLEFEPLIFVIVTIMVLALIFVSDLVVSTSRLLSTQRPDVYALITTIAYPILDGILLVPAILIFWAVRRISRRERHEQRKQDKNEQQEERPHRITSSPFPSSIWILLLCISMILAAIANSGFAFTSAFNPVSVQKDVWVWDILYNSVYLCLAAALIGYQHFFSFNRIVI